MPICQARLGDRHEEKREMLLFLQIKVVAMTLVSVFPPPNPSIARLFFLHLLSCFLLESESKNNLFSVLLL